jgi:hypothetical protein
MKKSITLLGGIIFLLRTMKLSKKIVSRLLNTRDFTRYRLSSNPATASFAVISGAASGIGRAFAFDLASKGFNLILLDIDQKQLISTKEQITMQYCNTTVIIYVMDFSKQDSFRELKFVKN